MSINIGLPQVDELKPRIAVIGVGGAGGNAIANMIAASVEGVDFIVANTDAQALNASPAERRIQLGTHITQGLGAGSRPEVGRAAAEESIADLEEALDGMHMCFIAAGMGGGTGTGAAPVLAKAARDRGILTVGVVTKPFTFEGTRRMRSAEAGIEELQQHVDTLIVIPNQNLFLVANPNTTFREAFQMADEVLQQGVRGITDLMVMPGLINLDFADVRSVMREMGKAMMGTGEAEGDGRALEAAQRAIANPLLDGVSMAGARGVIVSISGGDDMRLMEVDEAANHIRELVDPDANIIWGSAFNEELNGKIRVSVVATGIDGSAQMPAPQPATRSFSLQTPHRPQPAVAPAPLFDAPADSVSIAPAAPTSFVDSVSPAPTFVPSPIPPMDAPAAERPTAEQVTPAWRLPESSVAVESLSAQPTPAQPVSAPTPAPTAHMPPPVVAPEPAPSAYYEDPSVASAPRPGFTTGEHFAPPSAPSFAPAAPLTPPAAEELVLGADDRMGQPAAPSPAPAQAAATPPAPAAPRPVETKLTGGTLFERMTRLSRGESREERSEEDSGAPIPRFLNRQSNQ